MARSVRIRVLRQADPQSGSQWETFQVPFEPGMNVTTVLQRIADQTGGRFFPVDPTGRSIDDILVEIGALQKGAYAERSLYRYKNRYVWPLGFAVLALFAAAAAWERRGEMSI